MSNPFAKIFSAIPITGALGIDNVLLISDPRMSFKTRVTSGIMLALKLGFLITVIVLSSTMLDINPSIECQSVGTSCTFTEQEMGYFIPPSGPEKCPEYNAVLKNKDFRTWYKKQEYDRMQNNDDPYRNEYYLGADLPRTGEEFSQACKDYIDAREKQHMTVQQLSIVVVVVWLIGIVVAFRAKHE